MEVFLHPSILKTDRRKNLLKSLFWLRLRNTGIKVRTVRMEIEMLND